MKHIVTMLLLGCSAIAAAQQQATSAPGAKLYIVSPEDGTVVTSPVRVVFGLSGMGVAPAGIVYDNTGHHHLLLNTMPPALDKPIPADDQHLHFGKGQTEVELDLPPGEHTMQLLFADALHRPHNPPLLSEQITITVH